MFCTLTLSFKGRKVGLSSAEISGSSEIRLTAKREVRLQSVAVLKELAC